MATIVRWNPFREMAAMQSALDRMFDDTWRTGWPTLTANNLAFDVYDNDSAYTAVVSLPGLDADQISVRLEKNVLSVSAEIPQPTAPENTRVHIQERAWGRFSRSIQLPQEVDTANVEATYENGVLTLTLPKSPAAQPKLITVKSSKVLAANN